MDVTLNRRTFLRAGLTALALPHLPSLLRSQSSPTPPRRLIIVGNHLGFRPDHFFPKQAGMDYKIPATLKPIESHRSSFTVFSNLDHLQVKGGHDGVYTLLSGITKEEAGRFPDKNVTLDQVAARHVGPATRHRCLLTGLDHGTELSWDRMGTCIKPNNDPAALFAMLFENLDPSATARRHAATSRELSVLDGLIENEKALRTRLGAEDRDKLDQYVSSIREVETEIHRSRLWIDRPKPEAPCDPIPSEDRQHIEDLPLLMKLVVLALQTDSARVGTVEIPVTFAAHELGVNTSYHKLSHHGKVQEVLDKLQVVETFLMQQFNSMLDQLKECTAEDGSSLLDHCAVVLAGGLGDANIHKNQDLPILLAGGGFVHRGHIVCPNTAEERIPLSNLWLSLLQWFGVPIETFGKSTGTFRGMEFQ